MVANGLLEDFAESDITLIDPVITSFSQVVPAGRMEPQQDKTVLILKKTGIFIGIDYVLPEPRFTGETLFIGNDGYAVVETRVQQVNDADFNQAAGDSLVSVQPGDLGEFVAIDVAGTLTWRTVYLNGFVII